MPKQKQNKMKIAIIILSVALVVAIGGIFGVYAATQQKVTTSFSIGYSLGKNVAVAVNSRSVALQSDGSTIDEANSTWFVGKDKDGNDLVMKENSLYSLEAKDGDKGLILSMDDVVFSVGAHILCFYFENLSTANAITVTMTNSIVPTNMSINTYSGEIPNTEVFDSQYTQPLSSNNFTVGAQKIACCFLVLRPIDPNKSASFETTGSTGISFKIEQA